LSGQVARRIAGASAQKHERNPYSSSLRKQFPRSPRISVLGILCVSAWWLPILLLVIVQFCVREIYHGTGLCENQRSNYRFL